MRAAEAQECNCRYKGSRQRLSPQRSLNTLFYSKGDIPSPDLTEDGGAEDSCPLRASPNQPSWEHDTRTALEGRKKSCFVTGGLGVPLRNIQKHWTAFHHSRPEEKACPGLQDATLWHPEVSNLKTDIPPGSAQRDRVGNKPMAPFPEVPPDQGNWNMPTAAASSTARLVRAWCSSTRLRATPQRLEGTGQTRRPFPRVILAPPAPTEGFHPSELCKTKGRKHIFS